VAGPREKFPGVARNGATVLPTLVPWTIVPVVDRRRRQLRLAEPLRESRTARLALVGVVFFVLALVTFFVVPPAMVTSNDLPKMKDRLEAQNDIRTTGLQLLGGAVLALGAYLTWQNVLTNREARRIDRLGQITERFSRAVDQLGQDKLHVRLGGIYALERVARDSPQDHYVPVMEVLTAYVRTESHKEKTVVDGGAPHQTESGEWESAPDVQAALAVLGRRAAPPDPDAPDLDLQSADLRGAKFGKANLEHVKLGKANLVGAHLKDVRNLERADFSGARYDPDSKKLPEDFERKAVGAIPLTS
jgi:hypothetical protein